MSSFPATFVSSSSFSNRLPSPRPMNAILVDELSAAQQVASGTQEGPQQHHQQPQLGNSGSNNDLTSTTPPPRFLSRGNSKEAKPSKAWARTTFTNAIFGSDRVLVIEHVHNANRSDSPVDQLLAWSKVAVPAVMNFLFFRKCRTAVVYLGKKKKDLGGGKNNAVTSASSPDADQKEGIDGANNLKIKLIRFLTTELWPVIKVDLPDESLPLDGAMGGVGVLPEGADGHPVVVAAGGCGGARRGERLFANSDIEAFITVKNAANGRKYVKMVLRCVRNKIFFDVLTPGREAQRWEERRLHIRMLDNLESKKAIESYSDYVALFREACAFSKVHQAALEARRGERIEIRHHHQQMGFFYSSHRGYIVDFNNLNNGNSNNIFTSPTAPNTTPQFNSTAAPSAAVPISPGNPFGYGSVMLAGAGNNPLAEGTRTFALLSTSNCADLGVGNGGGSAVCVSPSIIPLTAGGGGGGGRGRSNTNMSVSNMTPPAVPSGVVSSSAVFRTASSPSTTLPPPNRISTHSTLGRTCYQLFEVLSRPESTSLDYKSYYANPVAEILDKSVPFMCGFLNSGYRRGKLVIGVHEVSRKELTPALRDDLANGGCGGAGLLYNNNRNPSNNNSFVVGTSSQLVSSAKAFTGAVNATSPSLAARSPSTQCPPSLSTREKEKNASKDTEDIFVHNDQVEQIVVGLKIDAEGMSILEEEISEQLEKCIPPIPPHFVKLDFLPVVWPAEQVQNAHVLIFYAMHPDFGGGGGYAAGTTNAGGVDGEGDAFEEKEGDGDGDAVTVKRDKKDRQINGPTQGIPRRQRKRANAANNATASESRSVLDDTCCNDNDDDGSRGGNERTPFGTSANTNTEEAADGDDDDDGTNNDSTFNGADSTDANTNTSTRTRTPNAFTPDHNDRRGTPNGASIVSTPTAPAGGGDSKPEGSNNVPSPVRPSVITATTTGNKIIQHSASRPQPKTADVRGDDDTPSASEKESGEDEVGGAFSTSLLSDSTDPMSRERAAMLRRRTAAGGELERGVKASDFVPVTVSTPPASSNDAALRSHSSHSDGDGPSPPHFHLMVKADTAVGEFPMVESSDDANAAAGTVGSEEASPSPPRQSRGEGKAAGTTSTAASRTGRSPTLTPQKHNDNHVRFNEGTVVQSLNSNNDVLSADVFLSSTQKPSFSSVAKGEEMNALNTAFDACVKKDAAEEDATKASMNADDGADGEGEDDYAYPSDWPFSDEYDQLFGCGNTDEDDDDIFSQRNRDEIVRKLQNSHNFKLSAAWDDAFRQRTNLAVRCLISHDKVLCPIDIADYPALQDAIIAAQHRNTEEGLVSSFTDVIRGEAVHLSHDGEVGMEAMRGAAIVTDAEGDANARNDVTDAERHSAEVNNRWGFTLIDPPGAPSATITACDPDCKGLPVLPPSLGAARYMQCYLVVPRAPEGPPPPPSHHADPHASDPPLFHLPPSASPTSDAEACGGGRWKSSRSTSPAAASSPSTGHKWQSRSPSTTPSLQPTAVEGDQSSTTPRPKHGGEGGDARESPASKREKKRSTASKHDAAWDIDLLTRLKKVSVNANKRTGGIFHTLVKFPMPLDYPLLHVVEMSVDARRSAMPLQTSHVNSPSAAGGPTTTFTLVNEGDTAPAPFVPPHSTTLVSAAHITFPNTFADPNATIGNTRGGWPALCGADRNTRAGAGGGAANSFLAIPRQPHVLDDYKGQFFSGWPTIPMWSLKPQRQDRTGSRWNAANPFLSNEADMYGGLGEYHQKHFAGFDEHGDVVADLNDPVLEPLDLVGSGSGENSSHARHHSNGSASERSIDDFIVALPRSYAAIVNAGLEKGEVSSMKDTKRSAAKFHDKVILRICGFLQGEPPSPGYRDSEKALVMRTFPSREVRAIRATCKRYDYIISLQYGLDRITPLKDSAGGEQLISAGTTRCTHQALQSLQVCFGIARISKIPLLLAWVFEHIGALPSPFPFIGASLSDMGMRPHPQLIPLYYVPKTVPDRGEEMLCWGPASGAKIAVIVLDTSDGQIKRLGAYSRKLTADGLRVNISMGVSPIVGISLRPSKYCTSIVAKHLAAYINKQHQADMAAMFVRQARNGGAGANTNGLRRTRTHYKETFPQTGGSGKELSKDVGPQQGRAGRGGVSLTEEGSNKSPVTGAGASNNAAVPMGAASPSKASGGDSVTPTDTHSSSDRQNAGNTSNMMTPYGSYTYSTPAAATAVGSGGSASPAQGLLSSVGMPPAGTVAMGTGSGSADLAQLTADQPFSSQEHQHATTSSTASPPRDQRYHPRHSFAAAGGNASLSAMPSPSKGAGGTNIDPTSVRRRLGMGGRAQSSLDLAEFADRARRLQMVRAGGEALVTGHIIDVDEEEEAVQQPISHQSISVTSPDQLTTKMINTDAPSSTPSNGVVVASTNTAESAALSTRAPRGTSPQRRAASQQQQQQQLVSGHFRINLSADGAAGVAGGAMTPTPSPNFGKATATANSNQNQRGARNNSKAMGDDALALANAFAVRTIVTASYTTATLPQKDDEDVPFPLWTRLPQANDSTLPLVEFAFVDRANHAITSTTSEASNSNKVRTHSAESNDGGGDKGTNTSNKTAATTSYPYTPASSPQANRGGGGVRRASNGGTPSASASASPRVNSANLSVTAGLESMLMSPTSVAEAGGTVDAAKPSTSNNNDSTDASTSPFGVLEPWTIFNLLAWLQECAEQQATIRLFGFNKLWFGVFFDPLVDVCAVHRSQLLPLQQHQHAFLPTPSGGVNLTAALASRLFPPPSTNSAAANTMHQHSGNAAATNGHNQQNLPHFPYADPPSSTAPTPTTSGTVPPTTTVGGSAAASTSTPSQPGSGGGGGNPHHQQFANFMMNQMAEVEVAKNIIRRCMVPCGSTSCVIDTLLMQWNSE